MDGHEDSTANGIRLYRYREMMSDDRLKERPGITLSVTKETRTCVLLYTQPRTEPKTRRAFEHEPDSAPSVLPYGTMHACTNIHAG